MRLGSAAVLLLLAALAAGERQRFCYKRVGYTRKYAERQLVPTDDTCQGDSCGQPAAATHYKTEVVFRTERHCCAGYQRAGQSPDACAPVCRRGCPQGEVCTAPNRCECLEGYERDSEGRCVAAGAPLLGEELGTLKNKLLSYLGALLDGVRSLASQEAARLLGHASHSTPAALEGNFSARAVQYEAAGADFSSQCAATGLQRCPDGPAGGLERWNSSRPLLLPPPALAAVQTH